MLPNLCVLHNFWFPVILFVSIFVHINASAFFDVHLCEFVCFLYDKHCESTETQPSHLQAAYKWMLHFSNCFFIDKWLWSVLGHCLSLLLLFLIEFHSFFATLWFSESKTLMLLHTAPCVFVYFITNPVCTYINLTLYVIMIWFLCFTSPIKYYYGETTLLILLSANHWAFLKLQKASAISFWFN